MARYITTMRALGRDVAWTLLQQARGMPNAKLKDDFLEDKSFVLFFSRIDLAERLCVTAAITQMRGEVLYCAPDPMMDQYAENFPLSLLGAVSYYMDGMILHGVEVEDWVPPKEVSFPIINSGSFEAHPAHALADIACMLRLCHDDLRGVKVAWVGGISGGLCSLVEATRFFPFSLSISVPEGTDEKPLARLQQRQKDLQTDISFHERPEDAVKGARFVLGGDGRRLTSESRSRWMLTPSMLAGADPRHEIMLGVNPVVAIPLDDRVVDEHSRRLILMQAEYRLRVYKRMLHWVFEL